MVSAWIVGDDVAPAPVAGQGVSSVAACASGWWYTAPLPGGRRLVSLHTDPATPLADATRNRCSLVSAARAQPLVAERIVGVSVDDRSPSGLVTASCGRLDQPAGDRWLAVGDAAFSVDPILSRGIFTAVYTGLCGASAVDRFLADGTDFTEYRDELDRIELASRRQTNVLYDSEIRFAGAPFWQRRQGGDSSD